MRWRIEEMFCVHSLKKLNMLFFLVSSMISFLSLKIEKQNIFFYVVVERVRSIKEKDKNKMFLYDF